jgi:hypothetical protein
VLALYGCGSTHDAPTTSATTRTVAQAAAPEPPDAVPDALRGSWKRTMKTRDWGPGGSGYPTGTWRLDIDEHGAVGVYLPRTDAVDFTTQFVVKGRHLTIDTIPVCPGQTARYTWRASKDELTLAVVGDDACKPRAALFGGTWSRRRATS